MGCYLITATGRLGIFGLTFLENPSETGIRGNYFDFHDIDEIAQKYGSCNFSREVETSAINIDERIREIEQD